MLVFDGSIVSDDGSFKCDECGMRFMPQDEGAFIGTDDDDEECSSFTMLVYLCPSCVKENGCE